MSTVDDTRRPMTTRELMELLRERYPKDQYAFFTEVPNGTGSHANRHADALAMSLWPSRGLHLNGFELKVSRSDWVKELKNPAKAESFARYCHFWYLVVASPDIVADGELPHNWGLLAPVSGKLKVITPARILEPEALSLPFIAGLFRSAQSQITYEAQLATIRAQEYQKGVKAGQESRDYELQSLRRKVEKFEQDAGVKLDEWRIGSIVEAMKLVQKGPLHNAKRDLELIRKIAQDVITTIDTEGWELR